MKKELIEISNDLQEVCKTNAFRKLVEVCKVAALALDKFGAECDEYGIIDA